MLTVTHLMSQLQNVLKVHTQITHSRKKVIIKNILTKQLKSKNKTKVNSEYVSLLLSLCKRRDGITHLSKVITHN